MASFNPNKIANKLKRQSHQLKVKKQKESEKRDERLRRRRREDQNPQLREARRSKNVPQTIESKRTWDELDEGEEEGGYKLGVSVDVLNPKRRKISLGGEEEGVDALGSQKGREREDGNGIDGADEVDSMLGSDSEPDDDEEDPSEPISPGHAPSEAPAIATTATDVNAVPDALIQRFPTLFDPPTAQDPKVLVTTSLNSTLHFEAELLAYLFPHGKYVKRTAHFHSYKYSVREICHFASARGYTTVVVLNEERKKPIGLDIVHLPDGPMFHFSISNWVEGKRLPGHGNPTNHYPELILNGFRTELGLLTAHLFKSLFPQRPEIQGRQVVTLHNQRDYIFFRRHRYVFRDKRTSEKSIQGADGKPVKGIEEIRAGLQELGPRFTLKLRRIDKGIQHASGQEWTWKAHSEKVRTRFSM